MQPIAVENRIAKLPAVLSFATVSQLTASGKQLIIDEVIDTIDLMAVEQSDSAGLALLIEWLRVARQQQQALRFINIPSHMQAFARVSGVDELLFT